MTKEEAFHFLGKKVELWPETQSRARFLGKALAVSPIVAKPSEYSVYVTGRHFQAHVSQASHIKILDTD